MASRPAIFLDTRPLQTGHAIRGIGAYTAQLREQLQLINTIRVVQTEEEADLIHYPFFDLFFPTLPLLSRKPRVVTIHDVIPLQFPDHYPPGNRGKLALLKQKQALRTVKAVITDSQASARAIAEYLPVTPEKITSIYLAANPALAVPDQHILLKVKERYALPDDYVLYVGDINYNKNLPALIKAMALLPKKVQLVLLGKNFFTQPIPEWQAIEQALSESGVTNRVMFLTEIRAVDLVEMSAIYHQAIAYIQPSLAEGFGLPVLEAMRCKVPVIAAQNSSLIEVGGDHALFITPTPDQIAEQVIRVRNWTNDKRQTWTHQAYQWQEHFTWQKSAEQTCEIYRQVLER